MTEKQMLKLESKKVKFNFRVQRYAVKSEVIEGVLKSDLTTIYIMRNNILKPYNHYDFWVINDKKAILIKWNQLRNISNLEVLENGKESN